MNDRTSCTTTGLRAGDNETARTPVLQPLPDNPGTTGVRAGAPNADAPQGHGLTPTTEQSGSPRGSRNDGNTSHMSTSSQVNIGPIKPVDAKQWGSNPGDHRGGKIDLDMSFASNPPAPRDRHQQTPISGRTPAAPAPQVSEGGEVVGD
jgi:hypothetical protein